jgi:hypothetical protein
MLCCLLKTQCCGVSFIGKRTQGQKQVRKGKDLRPTVGEENDSAATLHAPPILFHLLRCHHRGCDAQSWVMYRFIKIRILKR